MRAALVGLRPDRRRKQPALAPAVLKAYADSVFGLKGRVDLRLVDGWAGEAPSALCRRILAGSPGLVSFSCYVWNIEAVRELCGRIKRLRPDTLVVLGGPEASARARELLESVPADAVVRGEG